MIPFYFLRRRAVVLIYLGHYADSEDAIEAAFQAKLAFSGPVIVLHRPAPRLEFDTDDVTLRGLSFSAFPYQLILPLWP